MIVLQIAELPMRPQIMLVRPFPGFVVRFTPEPAIIGRSGIGEQRNRLVRPDAVVQRARHRHHPQAHRSLRR